MRGYHDPLDAIAIALEGQPSSHFDRPDTGIDRI